MSYNRRSTVCPPIKIFLYVTAKDLSLAMEDGEDEDLLNALQEAESAEDG